MILKDQVRKLALDNIRIVGYAITGCSECPFSKPHEYPCGEYNQRTDINFADPDEGHYDCSLLNEKLIWGEDPECTDTDWGKYIHQIFESEEGG